MHTKSCMSPLSPLISHVLLAEFDIDKGSILSCQYPTPTGADPATLAEWMLPEGAHLRQEDCTYFILNRTKHGKVMPEESVDATQLQVLPNELFRVQVILYSKIDEASGWTIANHGNSVIFVLRGGLSVVAIHPQTHHEQSWSISGITCEYWGEQVVCLRTTPPLVVLFRSNDDRTFVMRYIHESGRVLPNETFTVEKLPDIVLKKKQLLYVMNMVTVKIIAGARRGGRVKSIAVASQHPWVHIFKPLLILALERYYATQSEQVLIDLYNTLNAVDTASIPLLTFPERKILRTLLKNSLSHHPANYETTRKHLKFYDPQDDPLELLDFLSEPEIPVTFANISFPFKIPTLTYASEFGDFSFVTLFSTFSHPQPTNPQSALKFKNDVQFTWHPHLDSGPLTHPLMILIYALLTEKRVLFVGYGKPSSDVAACVLACTAIAAAGELVPDIVSRCFPYSCLATLDALLETPGYIAGVTNPVFEDQTAWWDVLCNLNTGKITISPKLIASAESMCDAVTKDRASDFGLAVSEDEDLLIQEISNALQKHIGEILVRQTVYNFVEKFICTAINTARPSPPQWRNKIDGYRLTQSYKNVMQSKRYMTRRTLFPQFDMKEAINELLYASSIPPDRTVHTYCFLDYLVQEASDDEIVEILSYLPCSDGSAIPFSLGLCHQRPEVRVAASHIIQRLFLQKLGNQFVNPFVKYAITRILCKDSVAVEITTIQSATTQASEPDANYIVESVIDEYADGYDTDETDDSGDPGATGVHLGGARSRETMPGSEKSLLGGDGVSSPFISVSGVGRHGGRHSDGGVSDSHAPRSEFMGHLKENTLYEEPSRCPSVTPTSASN